MLDLKLDPTVTPLLVLAGVVYVLLERRLRQQGSRLRWPRHRTALFITGLAVIFVALQGPVDYYADRLFSVHMGQHLALQLIAPPLLLLGAPITLLLRADPRWLRRRSLLRILRSRPVKLVAHPLTAWLLFVAATVGIHFSSLYEVALTNNWVHKGEHLLYLFTALLFWWPTIGTDPSPVRLSSPARLLYLFLAMPVMALVGVAIADAPRPLYEYYAILPSPYGPEALADQGRAGTLMWECGTFTIVPAMATILLRWLARDERDQSRLDAARAASPESSSP